MTGRSWFLDLSKWTMIEEANAAIGALNNFNWMDKVLSVNEARPKEDRVQDQVVVEDSNLVVKVVTVVVIVLAAAAEIVVAVAVEGVVLAAGGDRRGGSGFGGGRDRGGSSGYGGGRSRDFNKVMIMILIVTEIFLFKI